MSAVSFLTPVAALVSIAALALPAGASARPRDRDHDRMPDRWELAHHLSVKHNDARKDADRDGLKNLAEYRAQTDPRDADSDDDGLKDGRERAGTVTAFADGVLTLTLFDGSTLTGAVDARTEVECEHPTAPAAPATVRDGGRDEDEGDDDHAGSTPAPAPAAGAAGGTAPAVPAERDDDDEPGEDHDGDEADGEQDEDSCAAELVAGARVDEAAIALTSAGKVFRKIKLG